MENTTKRQRFEKVAAQRVQRIIDTLDLLKNCSNRNNYDYDEKDVEQMFTEISKHVREAKSSYVECLAKKDGKQRFNFD